MTSLAMNDDGSFLSMSGLEPSFALPPSAFWRRPERRMVLRGVDLTLKPGERVGWSGPSARARRRCCARFSPSRSRIAGISPCAAATPLDLSLKQRVGVALASFI